MWANAKRGHMISLTTQICVGRHARLPSSWAIGNLDRLPISHLATQSGTIYTTRCEGLKHLMKDQESFYDHVRAGESKLNDLESEIMRYIIELRDDIDDVTLKSVAERFFVAPNTISGLPTSLASRGLQSSNNRIPPRSTAIDSLSRHFLLIPSSYRPKICLTTGSSIRL